MNLTAGANPPRNRIGDSGTYSHSNAPCIPQQETHWIAVKSVMAYNKASIDISTICFEGASMLDHDLKMTFQ